MSDTNTTQDGATTTGAPTDTNDKSKDKSSGKQRKQAASFFRKVADWLDKPAASFLNNIDETTAYISMPFLFIMAFLGLGAVGTKTGRKSMLLGYKVGENVFHRALMITKFVIYSTGTFMGAGLLLYFAAIMTGYLVHHDFGALIFFTALISMVMGYVGYRRRRAQLCAATTQPGTTPPRRSRRGSRFTRLMRWIRTMPAVFTGAVYTIVTAACLTAFLILYTTTMQKDSSFIALLAGISCAIGLTIFFLYLISIRTLVRVFKKKDEIKDLDPSSAHYKTQLEELRDEQKRLGGAFAKGILWICIYMFWLMEFTPYAFGLKFWFTFNLSLFIALLVKDSSERGRKGRWTIGHWAEAVMIGGTFLYFICGYTFYIITGFENHGITGVGEFIRAGRSGFYNVAMIVPNEVNDWSEVNAARRGYTKASFKKEDRDGDGLPTAADTAFAIMDITGRGGMPGLDDLKAFPLYFRSTADTVVSELGDGTVDTMITIGPREWTLRATIGPHKQPVGDFNGDFRVTLEDSVDFYNYLLMDGHPPIYVTDPDMVPAKEPIMVAASSTDESDWDDQPAVDEGPSEHVWGERRTTPYHPDIAQRLRDIKSHDEVVAGAKPAPHVNEYMPQTLEPYISSHSASGIALGEVPGDAKITIEGWGSLVGVGAHPVLAPCGNPLHPAGADLAAGIPPMNHGEVFIRLSPVRSLVGDLRPPEYRRLNWQRVHGVWRAEIQLDRDDPVDIGLGIRDSNFSDNDGGFNLRIFWGV
ncbi:MAG: hypothetical protein V1685_01060 [Parcubacteria group bacterium]